MVIHFCNVNDTHGIVQALPTQLRWQNQALLNPGIDCLCNCFSAPFHASSVIIPLVLWVKATLFLHWGLPLSTELTVQRRQ